MSYDIPSIPEDAGKNFSGSVLIIGAGAAGLMAANTLKYMKVENYVVLEASNQFGGRIKEAAGFVEDIPLDIGAEWIHESTHDIVKDMLVFKPKEEEELTSQDFFKYQPDFFFMKNKARLLSWFYKEMKWKKSSWFDWLDKYVHEHVKEKIVYNSPVVSIDYSENEVRVTTNSGKVYVADKVICTVSLAVLQAGVVTFHPDLPEKKLKAISEVEMPPGLKILIEMKEKFYTGFIFNNSLCKQLMHFEDLCVYYDVLEGKSCELDKHVIGCIATGSKAKEFDKLSDDEAVALVLSKLDKIFDGKATANYKSHIVQNWTQEPFIRGTYSSLSSSKSRKTLRETLYGSLFFAGEHVSDSHPSMVTGACIEGRRAAIEAICESL